MKTISGAVEVLARLLLGTSFLSIGFVFLILGVTWLPIIGVLFSIPLMFLGFSAWTGGFYSRPVEIVAGASYFGFREYNELQGQGIIPVAILSTSKEKGEVRDFDARTVDPTTVSFGPNGVKPIGDNSNPEAVREHQRDVDGDGDTDLVFFFPHDQAGVSRSITELCLTGKTIGGTRIRGCTRLKAAV